MLIVWVGIFALLVAVTGGLFAGVERLQTPGRAAVSGRNFAYAETTFAEACVGADQECGGIR